MINKPESTTYYWIKFYDNILHAYLYQMKSMSILRSKSNFVIINLLSFIIFELLLTLHPEYFKRKFQLPFYCYCIKVKSTTWFCIYIMYNLWVLYRVHNPWIIQLPAYISTTWLCIYIMTNLWLLYRVHHPWNWIHIIQYLTLYLYLV